MEKVFLKIVAEFNTSGEIKPLKIIWEDGRNFEIDRVMYINNCVNIEDGGVGISYVCRVRNKIVKIFLEDNKWFLNRTQ
ncbi:MAG: hypothetical protein FWC47_11635 [Oscillospiraceae bacterium]|nr:hypothetical protein [Oscillospiraceae bacterium]